MTTRDTSPPAAEVPPDDVAEQARQWWALMRRDAEVADHLAAFSAWLDADDSHMAAFEHICAEHQAAQDRPRRIPAWLAAAMAPLGRRRWVPAAIAALAALALLPTLQSQPDVEVPPARWSTIAAADGSTLDFGPGSRAWMEYSDHRRGIRLDAGSVIIEAAKDPSRPMIVETAHGSVRVVGTRFTVVVDATGTEVSVTRGKVEATAASRPAEAAALTAAQRVRLSAHGLSRQAGPVAEPEEIRSGWRTLAAQSLTNLTAAVATETGRTIVTMPSAAERSGPISGRFFVRDAEATLALLTTAYGLHRLDAPLGVTILY